MKNSTTISVKLALVFVICICLFIPQFSILNLVHERMSYESEAMYSVSSQWGKDQTIYGPVIDVPYIRYDKEGNMFRRHAFFFPDEFDATSQVDVQQLEKGIFQIPVYTSENNIQVKFATPDFSLWPIKPEHINWAEAKMYFRVSDPRGILKAPSMDLEKSSITFEPCGHSTLGPSSICVSINERDLLAGFSTTIQLELKGTKALHLVPVGKSSSYRITTDWPHPNFQGKPQGIAPVHQEVNENGFTASWKTTKFNASFPYKWMESSFDPQNHIAGAEFILPANHYTKVERSVKYMMLIVALIFLSFLLSEFISRLRIHPFQYVLVGTAVLVFFILLLAFLEYVGYNLAYGISAISTIVLITGYCFSVFNSRKMVWI